MLRFTHDLKSGEKYFSNVSSDTGVAVENHCMKSGVDVMCVPTINNKYFHFRQGLVFHPCPRFTALSSQHAHVSLFGRQGGRALIVVSRDVSHADTNDMPDKERNNCARCTTKDQIIIAAVVSPQWRLSFTRPDVRARARACVNNYTNCTGEPAEIRVVSLPKYRTAHVPLCVIRHTCTLP